MNLHGKDGISCFCFFGKTVSTYMLLQRGLKIMLTQKDLRILKSSNCKNNLIKWVDAIIVKYVQSVANHTLVQEIDIILISCTASPDACQEPSS